MITAKIIFIVGKQEDNYFFLYELLQKLNILAMAIRRQEQMASTSNDIFGKKNTSLSPGL